MSPCPPCSVLTSPFVGSWEKGPFVTSRGSKATPKQCEHAGVQCSGFPPPIFGNLYHVAELKFTSPPAFPPELFAMTVSIFLLDSSDEDLHYHRCMEPSALQHEHRLAHSRAGRPSMLFPQSIPEGEKCFTEGSVNCASLRVAQCKEP